MPRHIALVLLVFATHVPLNAAGATARWGPDGLPVATSQAKQRAPNCWADGHGGLLISWAEHREGRLHDIVLQRLTPDGRPAAGWPASGVRRQGVWGYDFPAYLSWNTGGAAAPAGDGGIFLAWRDRRFVPPGASDDLGDLFLVRYDPSGAVASGWPVDGMPLSVVGWYESDPVLMPDGAGGVFVGWTVWSYLEEIRVDHVLASGERPAGWSENGVRVSRAVLPYQQDIPIMVPDGAGGIYVGWRATGESHAFGLNHILADGTPAPDWPDSGIALGEGHCQDLRLVTGPGSDIYAAWTEVLIGPTFIPWRVHAIRLGPQGTARPGWSDLGLIASSSSYGSQDLAAISDGAGGLYLVWPNYNGFASIDVRVQHLDPWGRLLFPSSAVPTNQAEISTSDVQGIADGAGGVIAAWSAVIQGASDYANEVYARRVSSAGELSYASTPHGNAVSLGAGSQVGVQLASDGEGGVYSVWTQTDMSRADSLGDIYAQWLPVSSFSPPGPLPSRLFLSAAYPNPAFGTTTVRLELPRAGAVEAAVFDARGARIRVLARGDFPAGISPLVWDGRDERGRWAASGIYFIDVLAGNERATRRIARVP